MTKSSEFPTNTWDEVQYAYWLRNPQSELPAHLQKRNFDQQALTMLSSIDPVLGETVQQGYRNKRFVPITTLGFPKSVAEWQKLYANTASLYALLMDQDAIVHALQDVTSTQNICLAMDIVTKRVQFDLLCLPVIEPLVFQLLTDERTIKHQTWEQVQSVSGTTTVQQIAYQTHYQLFGKLLSLHPNEKNKPDKVWIKERLLERLWKLLSFALKSHQSMLAWRGQIRDTFEQLAILGEMPYQDTADLLATIAMAEDREPTQRVHAAVGLDLLAWAMSLFGSPHKALIASRKRVDKARKTLVSDLVKQLTTPSRLSQDAITAFKSNIYYIAPEAIAALQKKKVIVANAIPKWSEYLKMSREQQIECAKYLSAIEVKKVLAENPPTDWTLVGSTIALLSLMYEWNPVLYNEWEEPLRNILERLPTFKTQATSDVLIVRNQWLRFYDVLLKDIKGRNGNALPIEIAEPLCALLIQRLIRNQDAEMLVEIAKHVAEVGKETLASKLVARMKDRTLSGSDRVACCKFLARIVYDPSRYLSDFADEVIKNKNEEQPLVQWAREYLVSTQPKRVWELLHQGIIDSLAMPHPKEIHIVPYEERGQAYGYEVSDQMAGQYAVQIHEDQVIAALTQNDDIGQLITGLLLAPNTVKWATTHGPQVKSMVERLTQDSRTLTWKYWTNDSCSHTAKVSELAQRQLAQIRQSVRS